ncbi:ABC transporter ATP-binding protein/permease [Candidatus Pelagibacter sp.]|nr:ABC transporter ATP-binding protein/permease [Candidatus Pelagibacter sp.]
MINISKLYSLLTSSRKKNLVFLIFLSLMSTIIEIFSIGLLIPLVSSFSGDISIINNLFSKFNISNDVWNFLNFENTILILLLVYVVKFVFLISFSFFKNNFYFSFQLELIDRLFTSYIKRHYLFHVSSNSARIIKNFSEEIHQVSIGYMGAIISIITETILIAVLLIFLLFLQTKTTIIVLGLTGLICFLIFSVLKKKIANLGRDREDYNFVNLRNIIQALGGIKEIKIFQKENEIINNFEKNSSKLKNVNWLISFYNEVPRVFFEFIAVCSFLAILYLFVNLGYSFSVIISYFVIIFAIFIRIMPSTNKLIVSLVNITINQRSIQVVHNELNPERTSIENNIKINNEKLNFKSKIEIRNLSFKYGMEDKEVIKNINLQINKGEIFGVIGETGSGKTTFVDLLIGLLEPTEGSILSDGKNIQLNRIDWFKKIGYVPQNIYLNDESIKKNIAFTSEETLIDEKKVLDAAKKSKLLELVQNKKDKLNFRIGERGNILSGGQKQRLGIARALYNNSEILVLDEFTSALDETTEKEIMKEISIFKGQKTIILSTHKPSVLKYCDRVFDVKNNTISKND